MEASDLAGVRHDLKNAMTALRSGCMLIESQLRPGDDQGAREILQEMRAELDKATALIGRLREADPLKATRGQ